MSTGTLMRVWLWLGMFLVSGFGFAGCFGFIGQDTTPDPNGRTRPVPPRPAPDGALPPPTPDAGTPGKVQPDQSTPGNDTGGGGDKSPNGCPPTTPPSLPEVVYFSHVQPFLNEYCVNCHGGGGSLPSVTAYQHPSHPAGPQAFWGRALSLLNKGEMPPQKPNACDDLERFNNGLRLFRKWASQGFLEKEGGSTPTDFEQDPFYKFPSSATCKKREPLASRIWRLTTEQLKYSIQDVFGASVTFPSFAFGDNRKDGFSNNAKVTTITSVDLTSLVKAYNTFSKEVLARLNDWKTCAAGTGNTCATQLATDYGKKLWRRPLTKTEVDSLTEQFNALEKEADRATALESVVERLLLSPHFLYRSEVGTPVPGKEKEGLRKLDAYEVASFLSYTIWQSVPDDTLLAAAAKDELQTKAQIQAQVTRMLADNRAKRGTLEFFNDWLRLREVLKVSKDAKLFASYDSKTRSAALKGSEMLINDVIWQRDGDLKELFTTNDVFANNLTAPIYGLSVPDQTFKKVTTPANERVGLLTSPAFLAVHAGNTSTGFVHRGVFFREDIACKPFSTPPEGVAEMLQDKLKNIDTSKMTMREIMSKVHSVGTCASCHKDIDPVGAAFENFDPIGKFRTHEVKGSNNLLIDASGELKGVGDLKPQFKNAVELIRNLADSQHFQQCYTLKLFTFAYGKKASAEQSCEIAKVFDSLKGGQFKLAKSYEALFNIEQLLYRKAVLTTAP